MLVPPLPKPTLRQLRLNVTICIAAMTGKAIVAICDTMASSLDSHGRLLRVYDRVMTKYGWIGAGWRNLYAGMDISHFTPIEARIRDTLNPNRTMPLHDFMYVADVCKSKFHDYWEQTLNDKLFSRFQTDLATYTQNPGKFTDAERLRLFSVIQKHEVPLEILIYGWDNRGAHIMRLESPGVVSYYDFCGFWSIGATAGTALDHLAKQHMGSLSTEQAMVRVFEAKFRSENAALGVGDGSDAWVMYWDAIDNDRQRELFIAHEDIEAIRTCCKTEAYNTTGQAFEKATDLAKLAIANGLTREKLEQAILGVHLQP